MKLSNPIKNWSQLRDKTNYIKEKYKIKIFFNYKKEHKN